MSLQRNTGRRPGDLKTLSLQRDAWRRISSHVKTSRSSELKKGRLERLYASVSKGFAQLIEGKDEPCFRVPHYHQICMRPKKKWWHELKDKTSFAVLNIYTCNRMGLHELFQENINTFYLSVTDL